MARITDLPVELLEFIIAALPDHNDTKSLSMVGHQLRNILQEYLYHHIYLVLDGGYESEPYNLSNNLDRLMLLLRTLFERSDLAACIKSIGTGTDRFRPYPCPWRNVSLRLVNKPEVKEDIDVVLPSEAEEEADAKTELKNSIISAALSDGHLPSMFPEPSAELWLGLLLDWDEQRMTTKGMWQGAFKEGIADAYIALLLSLATDVRHVHLEAGGRIFSNATAQAALSADEKYRQRYHRLESIRLCPVAADWSPEVEIAWCLLPSLQNIRGVRVINKPASKKPNFQLLRGVGMAQPFAHLQKLSVLSEQTEAVAEIFLSNAFTSAVKNLKFLDISIFSMTDKFMGTMLSNDALQKSLRRLKLVYLGRVARRLILLPSRIRDINSYGLEGFTDHMEPFPHIGLLHSFSALKDLVIDPCLLWNPIAQETINLPPHLPPQLQIIEFRNCFHVYGTAEQLAMLTASVSRGYPPGLRTVYITATPSLVNKYNSRVVKQIRSRFRGLIGQAEEVGLKIKGTKGVLG